jgi:glucokinase
MKILSVDIGGTYSRFSSVFVSDQGSVVPTCSLTIDTNDPEITSFVSLLDRFNDTKPTTFSAFDRYDAVVFAVAGPVAGNICLPPNIRWSVDLRSINLGTKTLLINDFVAQSYAYLMPEAQSGLRNVRPEATSFGNGIAIVGAGTGLGHCFLLPNLTGGYIPVPSEAGHACFAFYSDEEKDIERFILSKTGLSYCYNDTVVSGSGLSLIHEYRTGLSISPRDITANFNDHAETLRLFSRFYARACRNYCLSILATERLIISGGIAAKTPSIVSSNWFVSEFNDSPTHRTILETIGIYVNTNEEIGLLGAAYYAYRNYVGG